MPIAKNGKPSSTPIFFPLQFASSGFLFPGLSSIQYREKKFQNFGGIWIIINFFFFILNPWLKICFHFRELTVRLCLTHCLHPYELEWKHPSVKAESCTDCLVALEEDLSLHAKAVHICLRFLERQRSVSASP